MEFVLRFLIWFIFFSLQDSLLLSAIKDEYGKEKIQKEVYLYWNIVIVTGIILGSFNAILGLLVAAVLIFVFREHLHYIWELKYKENKIKAIIIWVTLVIAIVI